MTLVVAQLHDDTVSMVSDTKLTWADDPTRTRHVLTGAQVKIVILRDDLCVGVSGEGVREELAYLTTMRGAEIPDLLSALQSRHHAGFVVASIASGNRELWTVGDGQVDVNTTATRAWTGSADANEIFRREYARWPESVDDVRFRMLASMQWLTTHGPVDSVGGFQTCVTAGHDGFRFIPDGSMIPFPDGEVWLSLSGAEHLLSITPRPGADRTGLTMLCVVGTARTPRALAYFVPEAHLGLLFPQDASHQPIRINAGTLPELVSAATEHGQDLRL